MNLGKKVFFSDLQDNLCICWPGKLFGRTARPVTRPAEVIGYQATSVICPTCPTKLSPISNSIDKIIFIYPLKKFPFCQLTPNLPGQPGQRRFSLVRLVIAMTSAGRVNVRPICPTNLPGQRSFARFLAQQETQRLNAICSLLCVGTLCFWVTMIHRPCTHPGCGAYAQPGSSRCEKHRVQHNHLNRVAVRIRNSSQWQRVRRQVATSNPVCCDPFQRHGDLPEPTESIHHVFGLDTHPELAFVESNLRSLCNACHAEIEQMERKGEATQHLFETDL